MNNYTMYHLHSDISNLTAGTGADSITKFTDYLDKAQEFGMSAIAFSEHGSVMNWIKKKQEVEKRGLKYIHANEIYLTKGIGVEEVKGKDKLILQRDNYHFMTIAKNHDGVKELNELTSQSFNREDGHFYYNPRLTFDDLKNTSDNIIMTSACLASPIWRLYNNAYEIIGGNRTIKNNDLHIEYEELMQWFIQNKHRMFFEVQYHTHPDQIKFNQMLSVLSKDTGIPLIAGTDTHCLDKVHAKGRETLLKAKGASYGDEDKFDLTMKSYDELVDMFEVQGALSRNEYLEAIENTNVMANMIEEFNLDKTPKYPKLYDNPIEVFKNKINDGFVKRGFNKLPKEERRVYLDRVHEEFNTYEKLDAIDYMLLQTNIIEWCHENDIYQGYGRGSVNGSLIAYLLGVTEMDSVKHNLNFFRFLNPDRVSMPDIDVDFEPSRRQDVIDYLASIEGIDFAEIITFNTIATKGAIRDVSRALNIPLNEVDEISKAVDNNTLDKYRNKYKKLFEYVDLLEGTIVSMGSHPSGFVVSPIDLNSNVSTIYTKESKYKVTSINMKELDGQSYVKLDILGLDNIEIINEACKLANIERLTPDNIDVNDINVWKSLRDSTLGVFQFESDTAFDYVQQLFSDKTLSNIKNDVGEIDYISLLSLANGAIRPAGDSYRSKLSNGITNDNGHTSLNEFLKSNLGYLVFQEDIMRFLTDFCNHSGSESDSVRRGLSKKEGTEQFLPKIREGFIEIMTSQYGETIEKSEEILQSFLKVIEDASDYGFSLNHSQPYSFIGYVCAYLRYHYPHEFITTILNVREDKMDKSAKVIAYAKQKGIEIKPIKFGKSKSKYEYSNSDKAIYKGLKSIKYINDNISEELFELANSKKHSNFLELLIDITENTSVNTRQLNILIRLGFFSEFGNSLYLELIAEKFNDRYKKTHKDNTKDKRIEEVEEFISSLNDIKDYSINEKIMFEVEVLGYPQSTDDTYDKSFAVISDVETRYSPTIKLYIVNTGSEVEVKVNKKLFTDNKGNPLLIKGDLIKVLKVDRRPKQQLLNGKWMPTDVMQNWLSAWELTKKA
ncbi:DNA polymerase III subunit alpha [Lysinibacillus sp. NPDC086135]|uniref:DNA polymerase III subunit alpha n=1 Tax=Lysinibacillus sp. NPDC086135 TaxID=3364130 RepID=UPI003817ED70